jgi:hypothetical protein
MVLHRPVELAGLTRVDFAKLERLCTEGALHAVRVGCRLSVGSEGQNGDSD